MNLSTHNIVTELKSRLIKSPKEPLEFVSISKPNEIRIRRNQQKIKRHAAQIQSKKDSKRPQLISQVYEIAIPQSKAVNFAHISTAVSLQNWTETVESQQIHTLILSIKNVLDVKEFTPVELQKKFGLLTNLAFINSPIGASINSNYTLAIEPVPYHLTKDLRPLFHVWSSLATEDKSAYHILVSNAALLLPSGNPQFVQENTLSIEHYTLALQDVSSKLSSPAGSLNNAVLGTILGFACRDARLGRFQAWLMHMRGLKCMLEQYENIFLKTHPLRFSLLWVDINGSLALDLVPHFDKPTNLLEPHRENITPPSLALLPINLAAELASLSDIGDTVLKLADLSKYMNRNSQFPGFWHDNMALFQHFLPAAHDILTLSRLNLNSCVLLPIQFLREALRLTANVYLALIRRLFGIAFDYVSICRTKLLQFLERYAIEWSGFQSLHLWTFAILGIADVAACPSWTIAHISDAMEKLELHNWPDAVDHLREISWCDKLLKDEIQLLGSRVINSYNYGQVFEV